MRPAEVSFALAPIPSLGNAARQWVTMLLTLLALLAFSPASAQPGNAPVQTVWRLLDYVAVDYGGAVSNGRIASAAEYAEMSEFSATIQRSIAALPPVPARARLLSEAQALRGLIAAKAAPETVAGRARALASDLLAASPVPLAPANAPDPARGATL